MRQGEVETIAYNRDKGIGVTVYVGQRRGHASTADFADEAIRATVDKALAIARYTAEDPAAGLADPRPPGATTGPISTSIIRGTCRSSRRSSSAAKPKRAALAVDKRITNSEGATVARGESEFVYANTNGFAGGYRSSRHHIDCSVIGEDDGAMQRDYWYTAARAPRRPRCPRRKSDASPGERTARRLNARQLAHARMPGDVRGARGGRPDRLLRARGVGRQPVPQVVVPARFARAAGVRADRARSARSRTCRARAAARRSTAKVSRRSPRDVVRDGVRARLFPRQLFGAQARHDARPATPAAPQPRRRARAPTTSPALLAAHGTRPARHRAAGAGREPA